MSLELDKQPPIVLVDLSGNLPDRGRLAERIARALAPCGARILSRPDEPIDVLISDRATALDRLDPWPAATGDLASERAVGLIVLGQPAPRADVHLALDFSDREILLACRLVAEIVALRRRSQAAERSGHEMARLAAADALTGVANRRAWDNDAPRSVRRAQAAGESVCVALFDADYFKRVNDERGFSCGDAALAAVARELVARLRSGDLLARLGGDEFAALLCGSFDAPATMAIVDRVRSAAGRQASQQLGFELSLSAGCAVALAGQPADLTVLLAAADAAMRKAKRAGRNRTAPAAGL